MVLTREDFMSAIKNMVGDSVEDTAISFVENMTDTYNDLESKSTGVNEELNTKYNELSAKYDDLANRYKTRFFEGSNGGNSTPTPTHEQERDSGGEQLPTEETITFDDLFKEE